MRTFVIAIALAALATMGCNSFIARSDQDSLKALEKGLYALKNEVTVEGRTFKKGEEVRIVVVPSDEWIKINAFKAGEAPLKAERILILYVFKDDFDDKRFNRALFDQRFAEVVIPLDEKARDEKKGKGRPTPLRGR